VVRIVSLSMAVPAFIPVGMVQAKAGSQYSYRCEHMREGTAGTAWVDATVSLGLAIVVRGVSRRELATIVDDRGSGNCGIAISACIPR
jgi:hypothetical protein